MSNSEGIDRIDESPSASGDTQTQTPGREEEGDVRGDDSTFDQTNLFIGDLSKDCIEDDLYKVFSQYGEVAEVQIKRSKMTKNPLGY
eukprot:gene53896-72027_t